MLGGGEAECAWTADGTAVLDSGTNHAVELCKTNEITRRAGPFADIRGWRIGCSSPRAMTIHARSGVLLVACALGCADVESQQESSIVGGAIDTGDPEVVALVVEQGGGEYICTGTLIAPRVVLTAAHCVNFTDTPPSTFTAHFVSSLGDDRDPSALGTRNVVEWKSDPMFDETRPDLGHDIGIVLLDSPAPVAPKRYNRAPMDASIGTRGRVVGFGITLADRQDAGSKRQTEITIDGVTDQVFSFSGERGICQGDSGGPTFVTHDGVEVVAGIHSAGDCNEAGAVLGIETRVDRFAASFIDPFIAAHPQCVADGACDPGCVVPDPDCADGAGTTDGGGCAVGGGSSGASLLVVLLVLGFSVPRTRRGTRRRGSAGTPGSAAGSCR